MTERDFAERIAALEALLHRWIEDHSETTRHRTEVTDRLARIEVRLEAISRAEAQIAESVTVNSRQTIRGEALSERKSETDTARRAALALVVAALSLVVTAYSILRG